MLLYWQEMIYGSSDGCDNGHGHGSYLGGGCYFLAVLAILWMPGNSGTCGGAYNEELYKKHILQFGFIVGSKAIGYYADLL